MTSTSSDCGRNSFSFLTAPLFLQCASNRIFTIRSYIKFGLPIAEPKIPANSLQVIFQYVFSQKKVSPHLPKGVFKTSITGLYSKIQMRATIWNPIIDNNNMNVGIQKIPVGNKNVHSVNRYDKICYILRGKARFKVGDRNVNASSGSLFYIKTGEENHFYDIKKNIEAFVFFSKAKSSPRDSTCGFYSKDVIEKTAKPDSITWIVFHQCSTLISGILYASKSYRW